MTDQVRAMSIFSSRTMWLNAAALFVAVLSLTEVITLIPASWMPTYSAVVALINMVLRTVTVRPVAVVAPGATKLVPVANIGGPPPSPPKVGD